MPETLAEVVAHLLKPADRKALCSRPGSGSFSRATLERLAAAGLMNVHDFHPTGLGHQVRAALTGSREQEADNG